MSKLLYIEDDKMNRDVLTTVLSRKGYNVITANDGLQGINLAKAEKPDLILMDIRIPIIDGLEATRLLKADPATQNIVIIAVTAHAMPKDREKCLKAGCDDYISKPIDTAELITLINSYLNQE